MTKIKDALMAGRIQAALLNSGYEATLAECEIMWNEVKLDSGRSYNCVYQWHTMIALLETHSATFNSQKDIKPGSNP